MHPVKCKRLRDILQVLIIILSDVPSDNGSLDAEAALLRARTDILVFAVGLRVVPRGLLLKLAGDDSRLG